MNQYFINRSHTHIYREIKVKKATQLLKEMTHFSSMTYFGSVDLHNLWYLDKEGDAQDVRSCPCRSLSPSHLFFELRDVVGF